MCAEGHAPTRSVQTMSWVPVDDGTGRRRKRPAGYRAAQRKRKQKARADRRRNRRGR